jgi:hypothetical protein
VLTCGEVFQGAEACVEFGGGQAPQAVERAQKIRGRTVALARVAFDAAGNQVAVGIAAEAHPAVTPTPEKKKPRTESGRSFLPVYRIKSATDSSRKESVGSWASFRVARDSLRIAGHKLI